MRIGKLKPCAVLRDLSIERLPKKRHFDGSGIVVLYVLALAVGRWITDLTGGERSKREEH